MATKYRQLSPFGLWVRTRALERNVFIKDVAASIGIDGQYINKILRGDIKKSKHVAAIIRELGGNPEDLKDII